MDRSHGIVPKDGEETRHKFFVVLGIGEDRQVYGGVIFNSRINLYLPEQVRQYHLPIHGEAYPRFLTHNSFVDCSTIFALPLQLLTVDTYRGEMTPADLSLILATLRDNPMLSKARLRYFGLLEDDPS